MAKTMSEYAAAYKAQLQQGDIQVAYEHLVKYVMALRARFALLPEWEAGNVSPGYLDYTYFPFYNAALRKRKLRYGIVLNHREMRFELWLMGQNANVQAEYWTKLKDTAWNKGRETMPKYSVLEAVLADDPDFDDLDKLTVKIEQTAMELVTDITSSIT